ncbi:MAG: DUF1538 family protein [Magnetococcales bacterium]|nr:DUF1538 family protein [Magnetococcales bacterium]
MGMEKISASGRDLLPIVVVVSGFQIFVVQQPVPDFLNVIIGTVLVLHGLTLFMLGLESGLFTIGESMATAFARLFTMITVMGYAQVAAWKAARNRNITI